MDENTVVRKTPRGREEICTRAHDLGPLERRVLIMADGTRSVGDLAAQLGRAPSDPALVGALEGLLADHYVHTPDDYHERASAGSRRRARSSGAGHRSAPTAPLGLRQVH